MNLLLALGSPGATQATVFPESRGSTLYKSFEDATPWNDSQKKAQELAPTSRVWNRVGSFGNDCLVVRLLVIFTL